MFNLMALVRSDISEERIASIIRVKRIHELADSFHPDDEGDTFSDTSVLTRATQHNIPEDGILHSHCRENLKSYSSVIIEINVIHAYFGFSVSPHLIEIYHSRLFANMNHYTSYHWKYFHKVRINKELIMKIK
jgi:hypothetical protein